MKMLFALALIIGLAGTAQAYYEPHTVPTLRAEARLLVGKKVEVSGHLTMMQMDIGILTSTRRDSVGFPIVFHDASRETILEVSRRCSNILRPCRIFLYGTVQRAPNGMFFLVAE